MARKDSLELSVPEAARLFWMLGDEGRLRLLRLLAHRTEVSVGDLANESGMSQPAVSNHLARFRLGGLVECRRDGQKVFYHLSSPSAAEVLHRIEDE
jgi:DNA-binding transcriptional ArsR family regulator